jgi:hypothetical protein
MIFGEQGVDRRIARFHRFDDVGQNPSPSRTASGARYTTPFDSVAMRPADGSLIQSRRRNLPLSPGRDGRALAENDVKS